MIVITLNVGGTEFVTLRSTVFINPVLRDHCLRAEANGDFTHGGKAIFIDRDPAQFRLILQHLRDQACGLSEADLGIKCEPSTQAGIQIKAWKDKLKPQTQIQIPEEIKPLKELFLEARHYQIKELEDALCGQSIYLRVAQLFGGNSGNPFQPVTDAFKNLRRALVATGGVGMYMGSQDDDMKAIMGNFMRFLKGEPKKSEGGGSKDAVEQSGESLVPVDPALS